MNLMISHESCCVDGEFGADQSLRDEVTSLEHTARHHSAWPGRAPHRVASGFGELDSLLYQYWACVEWCISLGAGRGKKWGYGRW
jgi:hypothetical protein